MSEPSKATLVINHINETIPIEDVLEKECDIEVKSFPTQIFCPFHDDIEEPSARVYGGKKGMYCFGCGRTYLPFDFRRFQNMGVGEAINYFKEMYNVNIPENSDELVDGSYKLNKQISHQIGLFRSKGGEVSIKALKSLERGLLSSYRMDRVSGGLKKFIKNNTSY